MTEIRKRSITQIEIKTVRFLSAYMANSESNMIQGQTPTIHQSVLTGDAYLTRPALKGFHKGSDPRIEISDGFVPLPSPIRNNFSQNGFSRRSGSIA